MRLLFSIPMLFSAFYAFAGSAMAGTQDTWCYAYAKRAMVQIMRNFQSQCGYTGNRWGDNFSGHQRWCLSLPGSGDRPYMYVAGGEDAAREKMLRQCKAPLQPNVPFGKPGTKPPPPPAPVKGDCPSGWFKSSDGQCYQRLN